MSLARRQPLRRRGGFALLITVTLLAFLVILLVSLASLTRVETQVAANNQQLSQARQNALFALNVALGRLQELAGPDRRVTATADIVAACDESKRHWTGVWDGAYDIDPNAASFQNSRGWLVSGTAAAGAAGVTSPVADTSGNTLVALVGDGSIDPAAGGAAVTVESERILSTDAPGLDPSAAGHLIGRQAWWVGDEGVKARVNLVDPWVSDSEAARRRYSFVLVQRTGIERVDTLPVPAATPSPVAEAYPVNDNGLARVFSLGQLPLAQSSSSLQDTLRTASRSRFHDLTAASFSVLSDTARGGLKRDLTNWLAHPGATGAPADTDLIHEPGSGNDPYGLPRWGLVRSYAAIRADGAAVAPQAMINESSSVQHGLHPVVTFFRFGYNLSCAGPGSPVVVHVFPLLVLWNPYNVDIAAAPYELCYYFSDAGAQMRWTVENSGGRVLAHLNLNRASLDGTGASRHWRFPVAPTRIPAGKSFVFSLGASAPYQSGQNQLVHAADAGESVILTGAQSAPTAEELAKPVFWHRNEWSGGTVYVTLRSAPSDAAADVTGTLLPEGTLHAIHLVGYGSPGNSTYTVPAARPATGDHYIPEHVAPLHQLRTSANMASSGGIRPRWIANQNLRAPLALRPRISGNVNGAYYGDYERTGAQPSFDGAYASAGAGVTGATANDLILAEFQPAGFPLFSVAQLQHAGLSPHHLYPAYAVGNSLADPHIDLNRTIGSPDASGSAVGGVSGWVRSLYDVSYLLNRELWDRYFFSTVPATYSSADLSDAGYRLPNARHTLLRGQGTPAVGDLNGPDAFLRASSRLLVGGGFNVNSTSYEAWRALLSGHNQVLSDGSNHHSFSRYASPSGSPNQVYSGHRILSDAQIDRLAHNIVAEVKRRGPFLSLADFVNRRLLADPDKIDGYKGALQAAIDASDTETGFPASGEPARAPINNDAAFSSYLVANPTSGVTAEYDAQRFQGGPTRQAPYSSRLAFAPGYLTQADLLNVLGPVLTARSDTFRIRAYGEVVNPVNGASEGKAWCEAIVQRTPEYIESGINPWDTPAAGSVGERFGRRFGVVSFRWLNPSDI